MLTQPLNVANDVFSLNKNIQLTLKTSIFIEIRKINWICFQEIQVHHEIRHFTLFQSDDIVLTRPNNLC